MSSGLHEFIRNLWRSGLLELIAAFVAGAASTLAVIALALAIGRRFHTRPESEPQVPAALPLEEEPDPGSREDRVLGDIAQTQWRLARRVRGMRGASGRATDDDLDLLEEYARELASQLGKLGVVIFDPAGMSYDPGLDVKLISSEKRADLTEAVIIETVVPSVTRGGSSIVRAAVVVGSPAPAGEQMA